MCRQAERVIEAVQEMRSQLNALEAAAKRLVGAPLFSKVVEQAIPSHMQIAFLESRCRELLEVMQEAESEEGRRVPVGGVGGACCQN